MACHGIRKALEFRAMFEWISQPSGHSLLRIAGTVISCYIRPNSLLLQQIAWIMRRFIPHELVAHSDHNIGVKSLEVLSIPLSSKTNLLSFFELLI